MGSLRQALDHEYTRDRGEWASGGVEGDTFVVTADDARRRVERAYERGDVAWLVTAAESFAGAARIEGPYHRENALLAELASSYARSLIARR